MSPNPLAARATPSASTANWEAALAGIEEVGDAVEAGRDGGLGEVAEAEDELRRVGRAGRALAAHAVETGASGGGLLHHVCFGDARRQLGHGMEAGGQAGQRDRRGGGGER